MEIRNIEQFNLKDTVTCGQIFRYKLELDNSYTIILKDRVINIKQTGNILNVKSNVNKNLKEIILNYFDLKRDYNDINESILNSDRKFNSIILKCDGLRMIKQDPFETIIEYILSQNNGVPQITNSLNLISERYGKEVFFEGKKYFLFPTVETLSELRIEDFRNCKVGFRDKYLINILYEISKGNLDIKKIYSMNGSNSLNYLMAFKGIGPKVASCILLFAYQKFDVYPIDTWVKKFMKDEYNIEGEKNIRKYTNDTFGKYSGIAIQYMFHTKRNKN